MNSPLTRTGAVFGTLSYMAPEQFRDAKHIDVRADVYSFGVMLFEMISGERPFKGRDSQEYLTKHQSQPPPPLRSGNQALDSLVAKCLAKDRIHRFQDFREVRSELGAIFEQLVHEPVPEPIVGNELLAEECYNKGLSLANLGYLQAAIDCYDQAIS
jgi:serine/threonine protein kinase